MWPALADPTRRRILDLLRDRPRITGEIAGHFPISRIAVMRHLEVLSDSGLVTSRKRGRERWYYLNGVPLQRIHDRWFDPAASAWMVGVLRLKARLEADQAVNAARPSVDVAFDIQIEAPPTTVFRAITADPGAWWGHPMLRPAATGLRLTGVLGGLLVEDWEDGGAVLATVSGWAEDRHLELTGPFHLGLGLGVARFDLTASEIGTLLLFSFSAFGPVETGLAKQFESGWRELVAVRLKAFAESGKRLGIALG